MWYFTFNIIYYIPMCWSNLKLIPLYSDEIGIITYSNSSKYQAELVSFMHINLWLSPLLSSYPPSHYSHIQLNQYPLFDNSAFSVAAPMYWNQLPQRLRSISNIKSFEKAIFKQYLTLTSNPQTLYFLSTYHGWLICFFIRYFSHIWVLSYIYISYLYLNLTLNLITFYFHLLTYPFTFIPSRLYYLHDVDKIEHKCCEVNKDINI